MQLCKSNTFGGDTLGETCFISEIEVSALLFPCLIALMVGASLLGCSQSEMSMLSKCNTKLVVVARNLLLLFFFPPLAEQS